MRLVFVIFDWLNLPFTDLQEGFFIEKSLQNTWQQKVQSREQDDALQKRQHQFILKIAFGFIDQNSMEPHLHGGGD